MSSLAQTGNGIEQNIRQVAFKIVPQRVDHVLSNPKITFQGLPQQYLVLVVVALILDQPIVGERNGRPGR